MPLTVSLGWPIRSLVGAGIVPPLPDGALAGWRHRNIGGRPWRSQESGFRSKECELHGGRKARDTENVRTYGQYCPIARGAEIFAERWTPLIIRNLHLGCETFGEILEGAPGLSR